MFLTTSPARPGRPARSVDRRGALLGVRPHDVPRQVPLEGDSRRKGSVSCRLCRRACCRPLHLDGSHTNASPPCVMGCGCKIRAPSLLCAPFFRSCRSSRTRLPDRRAKARTSCLAAVLVCMLFGFTQPARTRGLRACPAGEVADASRPQSSLCVVRAGCSARPPTHSGQPAAPSRCPLPRLPV